MSEYTGQDIHDLMVAAEQGDADAQAKLGSKYLLGQGIPQDYIMAAQLFE